MRRRCDTCAAHRRSRDAGRARRAFAPFPGWTPNCSRTNALDLALAIRARRREGCVRLQQQRDVVARPEFVEPRSQEDVPGLAVDPREHREEHEALETFDVQRLHAGVEQVGVIGLGHLVELLRIDAGVRERLQVVVGRNPDLVHRVALVAPVGRQPVGLEHRAADVPHGRRMALEAVRTDVGDVDEVLR